MLNFLHPPILGGNACKISLHYIVPVRTFCLLLTDLLVAGRRERGWFPRRCANRVKQHECDNGNVSNIDSDDEPCNKKDD